MPCDPIQLPGGGIAIVCSRGTRASKCAVCGNTSDRLCDWKLTGAKAGKTCDKKLCGRCSTKTTPDKDLCPAHARMWATHPANPARKG
jgi:hypothetical protein